jgi:hypothetical protein
MFINNDGGGFADHIDVEAGTTAAALFDERLSGRKPEDYHIRVNNKPTTRDQILHEGDRVSMTPKNIEGAKRND